MACSWRLPSIGFLVVTAAAISLRPAGPAGARPPAEAGAQEAAGSIRFTEQLVWSDYTYPYGIWAADLDGDGDLDLTSADAKGHDMLYWFDNDGRGNFRRRVIQRDDPHRLERHVAADINRDGHPDIVIVENFHGHVKWFENPGDPKSEQLWKPHYITRGGLLGAYEVDAADLDGDGDLDVAASSWRMGNQFVWFENPGPRPVEEWTAHPVDVNQAVTRTIRAADFDRDGDVDLLGTIGGAGIVLWYENRGRSATPPWRRHVIDLVPQPVHGQPVDMDRDGDMDVVAALGGVGYAVVPKEGHQIAWYENRGEVGGDGAWRKHVIGDVFEGAFEAVAADLDGDGDVDVVATGFRPGRVAWFENSGDPKAPWKMHLLKDNWPGANQVIVGDLNGDGRPDIAAVAEQRSNELRWWRNEGAAKR